MRNIVTQCVSVPLPRLQSVWCWNQYLHPRFPSQKGNYIAFSLWCGIKKKTLFSWMAVLKQHFSCGIEPQRQFIDSIKFMECWDLPAGRSKGSEQRGEKANRDRLIETISTIREVIQDSVHLIVTF